MTKISLLLLTLKSIVYFLITVTKLSRLNDLRDSGNVPFGFNLITFARKNSSIANKVGHCDVCHGNTVVNFWKKKCESGHSHPDPSLSVSSAFCPPSLHFSSIPILLPIPSSPTFFSPIRPSLTFSGVPEIVEILLAIWCIQELF